MIAEDEPPYIAADVVDRNITVSYFTCCPPQHTTSNTTTIDVTVTRHCSDPITAPIDVEANDDENADAICELQGTRKYSRLMKSSPTSSGTQVVTKKDSFLCCDSKLSVDDDYKNNTTIMTNFLDDLECVPYHNTFYEASMVYPNQVGLIHPITCNYPEGEFQFPYSRPFDEGTYNDVLSTGRYQCCKNGPALPPFVKDSALRMSVYPVFILYWIAAILSAIVALGLVIPLLIELKNKKFRGSMRSRRPSRSRGGRQCYSTYNLYVVFLALLDLIYAAIAIEWYMGILEQRFYPGSHSFMVAPSQITYNVYHGLPISLAYVSANMLINATISYEVLVLLRSSHHAQRIGPPSLKRVTLQTGVICLITALYASVSVYLYRSRWEAGNNGNFEKAQTLDTIIFGMMLLFFVVPLGCVLAVFFSIWWRGYLPSLTGTDQNKREMRQLTLFFSRIVGVFFLIWLPALIGKFVVNPVELGKYYWVDVTALCFVAFQPTVTTCMIWSKRDARKYIVDLVTLSYLFGKKKSTSVVTNRSSVVTNRPVSNSNTNLSSEYDNTRADVDVEKTGAQNNPQSFLRPSGVYATAMTGAINGVTDNVADDRADDVPDDNADDGAADDIDANANADVDATI